MSKNKNFRFTLQFGDRKFFCRELFFSLMMMLGVTIGCQSSTEISTHTPEPSNITCPDSLSIWDVNWLITDSRTMLVTNLEKILERSGLAGQGEDILNFAMQYEVNPAFALAMFQKEACFAAPPGHACDQSGLGTRAWRNKNPGNIISTGECAGLPANSSCEGLYGEVNTDGRFGVYANMEEGIEAYFKLLAREYKPGSQRNCSELDCVVNAYCPPSECNTEAYVLQIDNWATDYQCMMLGYEIPSMSVTQGPIVDQYELPLSTLTPTPTQSASGDLIAYIGEDNNVWLVQSDGTAHIQVTHDASDMQIYEFPKWSPDGSKLAFTKRDLGLNQIITSIFVFEVDSFNINEVAIHAGWGFDWMPNGNQIIYEKPKQAGNLLAGEARSWDEYDGLWLLDLATDFNTLLIPPYSENPLLNPRVSPNGTNLIFDTGTLFVEGTVMVLGITSFKDPSNFVTTEYLFASCDWSTTGNTIACNNCMQYSCHPEINIVDMKGNIVDQFLTEQDVWIDKIKWSPNEDHIAYEITTGIPFDQEGTFVELIASGDLETKRLTTGTPLDWSPDGKNLLVSEDGLIYIVDINDGRRTELVKGRDAVWQPDGNWTSS